MSFTFNSFPFNSQTFLPESVDNELYDFFGGELNGAELNYYEVNGPLINPIVIIDRFGAVVFSQIVGRLVSNTQTILQQIVEFRGSAGGQAITLQQGVASKVISTPEVVRLSQVVRATRV